MERHRHRADAERVQAVRATMPQQLQDRLCGVQVVTGFDPAYIGLHYYHDTGDGRDYNKAAHCTWTVHQRHLPRDRRITTVVFPNLSLLEDWVILHEFGHALDERLSFDRPMIHPINALPRRTPGKPSRKRFAPGATTPAILFTGTAPIS
jgi:hypothetical protein